MLNSVINLFVLFAKSNTFRGVTRKYLIFTSQYCDIGVTAE